MATNIVNALVDRIAIRNRMLRLPLVRTLRKRSRTGRQLGFSRSYSLPPAAQALVEDMAVAGCHVTTIFDLLGPASVILRNSDGIIVSFLNDNQCDLAESGTIFRQLPFVYMLGLEPILLDIAEAYLGEPCYYLGICIKRERADMCQTGTRQWHMDIEDDRMLRLIIYLSDVDDRSGPFNYAPVRESFAACTALNYRSGYLPDDIFSTGVPTGKCKVATGPAGTLIAFDGTRLFHRAGRPVAKDRLSLSITYCSRHPKQILRPVRLHWKDRRRLLSKVDGRQRACIPLGRLT